MARTHFRSLSAGGAETRTQDKRSLTQPETVLQHGQPAVKSLEAVFSLFLRDRHCRYTPQRKVIAVTFWCTEGHLTIDELFVRVHAVLPSVGQSTVYRTMRLLCAAGLAREVSFGRGVIRYERMSALEHDHFICERCGRSVEFADPEIGVMGKRVARRHGFALRQYRLYLYGLCAECLADKADKATPQG